MTPGARANFGVRRRAENRPGRGRSSAGIGTPVQPTMGTFNYPKSERSSCSETRTPVRIPRGQAAIYAWTWGSGML